MIDYTRDLDTDTDETLVVRGMPARVYHGLDRLNASTIAEFAKSTLAGAHYLANGIDPSMDMKLGTAIHARLLEPKDFLLRAQEYDDIGPGAKAKMAEYEERYPDQIVLARGWTERIDGVRQAIRRNAYAEALVFGLPDSQKELTVLWSEDIRGERVRFRARLDYIQAERKLLADVKSTSDVSAFAFERKIADLNYHVKGELYCRGAMISGLVQPSPDFVWVALETKAPYGVLCFEMDDDMHEQAEAKMGLGIARWQAYRHDRPEPYPPPMCVQASLPLWAREPEGSLDQFRLEAVV